MQRNKLSKVKNWSNWKDRYSEAGFTRPELKELTVSGFGKLLSGVERADSEWFWKAIA